MIKGDDLLNEDTSHIIKSINENEKNEKKLSYNTQLIITIIVGAFILYCGFYTLYYVYIVPNTNRVGQVLNVETVIDEAEDLLLQVPYSLGEAFVYSDSGSTNFLDLSNDFIVKFLIETLDTSEYMSVTNCDFADRCFQVTSQTIENKYLSYYGEALVDLPLSVTLSSGVVCDLEYNTYNCSGDEIVGYSGKISVTEAIKEDEEYYYVYETALFTSNLEIDGGVMTFDYVSLKPSIASSLVQNGEYEVSSTSIESEIYNLFSSDANIYLHTFVKDGESYYWQETQVVSSLP